MAIVNQSATASGVQMTANSGTGLYIRKTEGNPGEGTAHTGTFSEEAKIAGTLANAKFEPCTSATSTTTTPSDSGTATTTVTPNKFNEFKPTFAKLSKVEKTSLTYEMITGTNITSTDVYGAVTDSTKTVGDNTDTKAYYYNFKIDYMITTGKKLNIGVENVKAVDSDGTVISGACAKDEYYYETTTDGTKTKINDDGTKAKTQATEAKTITAGTDEASLDKATRVAFLDAATYGSDDKVTYAGTGTEYAIATACTKDHNLNALKELGYTTGGSEYKNDPVLSSTNLHKVTTLTDAKTTSDGSFTYGSVDVYVWFDGTDKACTNAIFSKKVTFDKCLFM